MTTSPLGRIVRSLTAAAMLFAVLPAVAQADLSGGNNYYRVSADASGWFDVMTGTYHTAGSAEQLVHGGFHFVHSYTSGESYELVYEAATLTAITGGVRQTIRPDGPDSLVIQQDTVVTGTTQASSMVKTTLRLQNTGSQTLNVGARTAMDVTVTDDDGPRFAADGEEPVAAQSRIPSPSFRTFTLEDEGGAQPEERTRWTAAATDLKTTPPDVIDISQCCWSSFGPLLPPLTDGDWMSTDSEIRWVWGADAAHGRTIPSGKTITFSVGAVLSRGDFVTANTKRPAISGSPQAGATLTATRGTWTQTALTDFGYQWQRCDAAGAGCAAIQGATATTYQLMQGDVGHRLKVRVTADNAPFADSAAGALIASADVAAPALEIPTSAFAGVIGAGTSTTSTPVQTTWSGSDGGSGICSYALAVSRGGGAFTTVGLASPTTTSVTQNLDAGARYVYRVTATDCAGNATVRLGGAVAPMLHDAVPGAGFVFTGTWSNQAYGYAFGGALRGSTTAGAKISFSATTRGLAFAARRAPGRGKVKISVDGGPGETVDLGTGVSDTRAIVFQRAFADAAPHTITVENLATPGRTLVQADAFASFAD